MLRGFLHEDMGATHLSVDNVVVVSFKRHHFFTPNVGTKKSLPDKNQCFIKPTGLNNDFLNHILAAAGV